MIIPARNEVGTIKKCIDYLIKQKYPEDKFEIIPVNDASNDGTEDLINEIAKNVLVWEIGIAHHARLIHIFKFPTILVLVRESAKMENIYYIMFVTQNVL